MSELEADFKIGIVGGRGRMGSWLARYFADRGCGVKTCDTADGPLEADFPADCDILILAVPISAVEEVMQLMGPSTRPDGVVTNICSVQGPPLESMLAHARGEVVGTHPLFGPSAPDFDGQTVFICPGRGETWAGRISQWLAEQGAHLKTMSAAEHDKLMARVQSLRHMASFAFGAACKELGFNPDEDLAWAGPWFGAMTGLLKQQCEQPADLYAELALTNPQSPEACLSLAKQANRLGSAVVRKDREALLTAMSDSYDWLKREN